MKNLVLMVFLFFFSFTSEVFARPPYATLLLFDKKTNELQVAEYNDDRFKVVKTYKATTGQVKGDKEEQGDLKTPEGIYILTGKRTPPALASKFGAMAFPMSYPNPYDRLAGRTGDAIMLHSTDSPERLKKNFDSEGCIVVNDEQIRDIEPWIELGLTPILVFNELIEDFYHPKKDQALVDFFKNWISAWEGKRIDGYMNSYHSEFVSDGKDWNAWKAHKNSLNQKYETIRVHPTHVHYYRHPKYSVIMFTQNYESTLPGGKAGFRSSPGTKILYVAEEGGKLKIIDEDFTEKRW